MLNTQGTRRIQGALAAAGLFLAVLASPSFLVGDGATTSTSRSQPKKSAKVSAVTDFGVFQIQPPKEWKPLQIPHGSNRKARYALPAPKGKKGNGELIVHFFGAGGAGGVEANIKRWIEQFERPEGVPDEEYSNITKQKVAGLPVTILEVRGNYAGMNFPGAPREPKKMDHMMLAAIVETAGGPYYFKAIGPRDTMTHWKKPFFQMILKLKATKS